MFRTSIASLCVSLLLHAQQGTAQDEIILERGDKLLEEAKTAYEDARTKSSVAAFVDAGFKLEEARIKFIVVQEIGSPEKQKIATDRLRAVNQLSKLIHDGKVAISGAPGEASAPKPAEPIPEPAAKDPSPNPAPPPANPPVDVTKRAPVPEAAKQKEAEKLIKDLFKDQYAKKAPVDRKALGRLLLTQAAKSRDDLPALWVLYREAQDIAVQGGDVKAAVEALEATAQVFDIDALPLKAGLLTAASKTAKAPEEFAALVEALQLLIDELIRADQYDAADKAAASALQFSRKANDAALAARAASRTKEIAEAKTLFQGMKSSLETQAKTPDDPGANLEIGQFLCFVKGSWDLGLRFIVKGSDPALKTLAQKELAIASQPGDRIAVADGWYDLGGKEKSVLRKSQVLAHAKAIYQDALTEATSLARAKIEKRLELLQNIGPTPTNERASVDLLRLIDPAKDAIIGEWTIDHGALVSPSLPWARVQIPYSPPEEYEIAVTIERRQGDNALGIGCYHGTTFAMLIDGYPGLGGKSCLDTLDGITLDQNPLSVNGLFLKNNATIVVVVTVKKTGITVKVDSKVI
ncbi:MAG TPA: hypothetical protein VKU80_07785, partial [Planctomycetota bacterium]|nr:hypothetical protein [Planctomycetota bacterium]